MSQRNGTCTAPPPLLAEQMPMRASASRGFASRGFASRGTSPTPPDAPPGPPPDGAPDAVSSSWHRFPEHEPLLGRKPAVPPSSMAAKWRARLGADVSRSHADLVLLLCYVVTGLLDSASTQVWGAFVSMQTGNTVYVGLGLASVAFPPVSARLYRSGASLLAFCVGSFAFARFHRFFSPRRRWVLCASFAAQALFAAAAAAIVTAMPPPPDGGDAADPAVLVPLALVAFQSCAQAVTSRALRYNALTSVVLTSIYCDLFSDPALFAWPNAERNRRAAAPLLLLAGAVAGGIFSHSSVGIAGALWTAAALKLCMVVAWLFWPAEPRDDGAANEAP